MVSERVTSTYLCLRVFQLLLMNKEIVMRELDFLLRFNIDHSYISPVDFLSNSAWSAIKVPHTHTHPNFRLSYHITLR